MEEVDAEVAEVFGCVTSASTRAVYIGAIVRFVAWIWARPECHHLLVIEFTVTASAQGFSDNLTRTWLTAKPLRSPIQLQSLSSQDFLRFLVQQRRQDGEPYSKSVMDNFRSSLVFLFSATGRQMEVEFAARLTLFYNGVKRKVTRRRQDSNTRMTEGKEPFSFALYRKICLQLLSQDSTDAAFTRCFLIVSWNLMCRAANTEGIWLAHVGWVEDALAIKFSHMKNDQEGDRPGDARHVYANPVISEVCPVLALSIYCMVYGFSEDGRLFPGKHQYDRYTKALKRATDKAQIREDLETSGFAASDFGSHSARKGSATFVSSCSTSGPSASSICLRAGWSLPGVQDTYIRYEAAGDMVVGRFVSGLLFESPDFAIQPPFIASPESAVYDAV